MATDVTITEAMLREAAERAEREAAEAESAREAAEAIYHPLLRHARQTAAKARQLGNALREWETGGDLSWQAVAGAMKRLGLVNSGGAAGLRWDSTPAEKEAKRKADRFTAQWLYGDPTAVRLAVNPGSMFRPHRPYGSAKPESDEERTEREAKETAYNTALEDLSARVRTALESEGYAVTGKSGIFTVRRGPALVAQKWAERGISLESIFAAAGITAEGE